MGSPLALMTHKAILGAISKSFLNDRLALQLRNLMDLDQPCELYGTFNEDGSGIQVECGNEEFRTKGLRRKGSNDDIQNWFNTISDSGIPYSVNLIIGFPGETREMVMETVELTRNINRFDTITVSIFTPYHGTVLRDVAVKNGWLDDSVITVHTTSSSLLDMPAPYLSKHDIDRLMLVIPLYVYFDKEEWPNIYRIEMMDDGWEELYNYYSLRYKTEFLGEDLGSDMLERPANSAASTSACASDPKNEVRSKIEINNVVTIT